MSNNTETLRAADEALKARNGTLEVQMKPLSELIAEIKTAAENATCGKWSLVFHDDGFNTDDGLILRDVAGFLPIAKIEGASPDSGFDESFQKEQLANAEFIEAAQPENVLELIAALEQAQQESKEQSARIAELESQRQLAFMACNRWRDKCAELEARPLCVKLRKYNVSEVMLISGFDRQYAEGWCAGNDNAIHEIRAAGGAVEGSDD